MLQSHIMNLLEPTWYNANVLESLLLKVFNEETDDAFMIGPDLKIVITRFALGIPVGFKLVRYLL